MSEYFVGQADQGGAQDTVEPAIPGLPPQDDADGQGSCADGLPEGPEHVRFGVPFNGVVPIWHDGTQITWHRPLDGTDLAQVLGLGHVETEAGPSPVPQGWSERVETGTLLPPTVPDADSSPVPDDDAAAASGAEAGSAVGPVLTLRAATPSGRRAVNDPGSGAPVPLSEALSIQEAMGETAGDFDITGFSVHIARLMLRAARDRAILLFTLRAPGDPEAHHLLSAPSEVDDDGVLHFHLGTLLEVEGGAWERAQHSGGMALLDLDVPYSSLLAEAEEGGDQGEPSQLGLDVERLIAMAQPVVDVILQPGFPFALGCSFIIPDGHVTD
ncbi:hypothetical protein [Actinomyces faecalis]|uniref:hypothetical protein n=1 Tax=Actinomyces faecalis TaxID=2722820 RepID=UPI001C131960|nr:hypothetical protein [Actinomyces faecalis]